MDRPSLNPFRPALPPPPAASSSARGMGAGSLAFSKLLFDEGLLSPAVAGAAEAPPAGGAAAAGPMAPKRPPVPGQGQVGHLAVHDRQPVAGGHVRLQARAAEAARPAAGRGRPQDRASSPPAASCSSRRSGGSSTGNRGRGFPTSFPTPPGSWTTWRSSTPATPRPTTTPPAPSRSARASCGRAGPAWGRGSPTAWARAARTCRLSWSCTRPSRAAKTRSGRRGSCRRITRGWPSTPATPSRSPTWTGCRA